MREIARKAYLNRTSVVRELAAIEVAVGHLDNLFAFQALDHANECFNLRLIDFTEALRATCVGHIVARSQNPLHLALNLEHAECLPIILTELADHGLSRSYLVNNRARRSGLDFTFSCCLFWFSFGHLW